MAEKHKKSSRTVAVTPVLCCLCGKPSASTCARCKVRKYCGRSCQLQDWQAGHKKQCIPSDFSAAADLLRPMFLMLDVPELSLAAIVCRKWRAMASKDEFWDALWHRFHDDKSPSVAMLHSLPEKPYENYDGLSELKLCVYLNPLARPKAQSNREKFRCTYSTLCRNNPLKLDDSPDQIVGKMCQGNFGGIEAARTILLETPGPAGVGFQVLCHLDDMNLRGERLYVIYKKFDKNLTKMKEIAFRRDESIVSFINGVSQESPKDLAVRGGSCVQRALKSPSTLPVVPWDTQKKSHEQPAAGTVIGYHADPCIRYADWDAAREKRIKSNPNVLQLLLRLAANDPMASLCAMDIYEFFGDYTVSENMLQKLDSMDIRGPKLVIALCLISQGQSSNLLSLLANHQRKLVEDINRICPPWISPAHDGISEKSV
eukprot:GILK01010894.1.p1 GENE.GILK01010894.1~~GILK01010894.1.p1  ORF type:complete len:438 (-),score=35.12 GILK01010894.1:365-1651(-)